MERYILALDQGTTSSRALIFNRKGQVVSVAQKEFRQIFPRPGWVEHNPEEIWNSQMKVAAEAMSSLGISKKNIAGTGITNQRETTVIWDRKTGKSVYNAIVWQDRRTSGDCDVLKGKGLSGFIHDKSGLVIDAYFSATKIRWILDHVEGVREKAEKGQIAFGTIDTWLVWKLTGGKYHITDVTNASRTMLYNIKDLKWDKDLLDLFGIPEPMLPEVRDSSEVYGIAGSNSFLSGVPLCGIAGDQQAALFGQMCTEEGMVKNTYGTGCFILMNTGISPFMSENNLITTIAWKIGNQVIYALEGSIFAAGAVVQWLRDGLGILNSSSEVESLASAVPDNGGVYFVPAFTGLGAPYWDQHARALITGISRGTGKGHIARAALESIAFQTREVLNVMQKDTGIKISELRVDGGAAANNLLMQFQADILGIPVIRPKNTETTAAGAAYLAGLATRYWDDIHDLREQWQLDSEFTGGMEETDIERLVSAWEYAIKRTTL